MSDDNRIIPMSVTSQVLKDLCMDSCPCDFDSQSKSDVRIESLSDMRSASMESFDMEPENQSDYVLLTTLSCKQMDVLVKQAVDSLKSMTLKVKEPKIPSFNHNCFISQAVRKIFPSINKDEKILKVFGEPLVSFSSRYATCAPPSALEILEKISTTCSENSCLFRRSGNRGKVHGIKNYIEHQELHSSEMNQCDFDFISSASPYDLADVFKQYVHQLPESILTNDFSSVLLYYSPLLSDQDFLRLCQFVFRLMPEPNREFLQLILQILHKISQKYVNNQMNIQSVATCWAPAIFKIEHFDDCNSFGSIITNFCQHSTNCASDACILTETKVGLGIPEIEKLERYKESIACLTKLIHNYREIYSASRTELNESLASTLLPTAFDVYDMQGLFVEFSNIKRFGDVEMQIYAKQAKERLITGLMDVQQDLASNCKEWKFYYETCSIKVYSRVFMQANSPGTVFMGEIDILMNPEELLKIIINKQQQWDPDTRECMRITRLDSSTELYYHQIALAKSLWTKDFTLIRYCTSLEDEDGGNKLLVCLSSSFEFDSRYFGLITPGSKTQRLVRVLLAPSSERRQRGKIFTEKYILQISPKNPNATRVHAVLCIDVGGKRSEYYRIFTPALIVKRLKSLNKFCDLIRTR